MNKIYHYHPETREFLGSSDAQFDPIEKKPLIPAYATTSEPPAKNSNEAVIFIDGVWKITPDYRGISYYLSDGTQHTVKEIGETVPANALEKEPPPSFDEEVQQAIRDIQAFAIGARAKTTAYADQYKLSGWADKAQRAQRVTGKAASKADMDVLQAEAEQRGRNESPEELAQKQLGKAQAQARSVALIDGIESAALDAIGNAQTSDEVEAIVENHRQALETALAADPAVATVAKRKIPGSDALKKLVGIASPN